jgi:hypothetical protein
VTLAQKGKAQFAFNQSSTGSYQLRSGANGYPTATGETVYEAANGDLATRVYATVTVTARATPTPAATPVPAAPTLSLSPASGTTCHPKKMSGVVTPCSVTFNASGTGYTSLAWSGCCAGSTGTTGTCRVDAIEGFTCSVTATGAGGTTRADGTANGTNAAPTIGAAEWYSQTIPLPRVRNIYGYYNLDSCVVGPGAGQGQVRFDRDEPYVSSGGTCTWTITWEDGWGARTSRTYLVEGE